MGVRQPLLLIPFPTWGPYGFGGWAQFVIAMFLFFMVNSEHSDWAHWDIFFESYLFVAAMSQVVADRYCAWCPTKADTHTVLTRSCHAASAFLSTIVLACKLTAAIRMQTRYSNNSSNTSGADIAKLTLLWVLAGFQLIRSGFLFYSPERRPDLNPDSSALMSTSGRASSKLYKCPVCKHKKCECRKCPVCKLQKCECKHSAFRDMDV